MIKFDVTSTPTVSEPRTTVAAATRFPRFRDDAAFGTYGTDGRRRGCCVYMQALVKTHRLKHENSHLLVHERMYLHRASLALTFAGVDALRPLVISVSVAGTSTMLVPSTARSATTGPA